MSGMERGSNALYPLDSTHLLMTVLIVSIESVSFAVVFNSRNNFHRLSLHLCRERHSIEKKVDRFRA